MCLRAQDSCGCSLLGVLGVQGLRICCCEDCDATVSRSSLQLGALVLGVSLLAVLESISTVTVFSKSMRSEQPQTPPIRARVLLTVVSEASLVVNAFRRVAKTVSMAMAAAMPAIIFSIMMLSSVRVAVAIVRSREKRTIIPKPFTWILGATTFWTSLQQNLCLCSKAHGRLVPDSINSSGRANGHTGKAHSVLCVRLLGGF